MTSSNHTLKMYGIPNCNTVKKARQWLDEHHIDYVFYDFKKQSPTSTELQQWIKQASKEVLINRRGTTWRMLNKDEQAFAETDQHAIQLMLNKPSVIKRPVLLRDNTIIAIGFSEAEYSQLF